MAAVSRLGVALLRTFCLLLAVSTGVAVAAEPAGRSGSLHAHRQLLRDPKPPKQRCPSCTANTSTVAPPGTPPIPDWVVEKKQLPNAWKEHMENVATLAAGARAKKSFDLLLYGDSVTSYIKNGRKLVWDKVFAGFAAEPLPMPGSAVEEIAWRITVAGEYAQPDPKVIALLAGNINIRWRGVDPSPHMDWLVGWLRIASPTTKIVLVGILPNEHIDPTATNKAYARLAKKHGAIYANCGRKFDWAKHTEDGTHPNQAGQQVVLECLKRVAAPYMK